MSAPLAVTFGPAPAVRDVEDGIRQVLLESLHVTVHDRARSWSFIVPAGFVTDYASIPRLLQNLLPPRGRGNRANIAHDYLYQYAPIDLLTNKTITQQRADQIKLLGDAWCGEPFRRRRAMYRGLRLFGWWTWRTYRRRPAPAEVV